MTYSNSFCYHFRLSQKIVLAVWQFFPRHLVFQVVVYPGVAFQVQPLLLLQLTLVPYKVTSEHLVIYLYSIYSNRYCNILYSYLKNYLQHFSLQKNEYILVTSAGMLLRLPPEPPPRFPLLVFVFEEVELPLVAAMFRIICISIT